MGDNMDESQTLNVLKRWFEKKGFRTQKNTKSNTFNKIDLIALNELEEWLIEVKGDYEKGTAQYSVNFDTGIGQLLKSITKLNRKLKYAICIPFSKTERGERLSYRLILKKYSKSIAFELLNIHLILVRDDESVEVINPNNVRSFFVNINTEIRYK